MKIIIGFMLLYLIMPYFGLFTFTEHQNELFGNIDNYFVLSYSVHLIIIFSIVLFILVRIDTTKTFKYTKDIKFNKINSVLNRSILFLFISIFFQLFVFGGIDILLGNIGRGEFRVTLGFLGFLYNFFTMFLPATIIAIASIYYNLSSKDRVFKLKLSFIYFLALLIGVLTGFKFAAILIISAGLVHMSSMIKIKHIFLIGIVFMFLMTFSAYYFMHLNPMEAFHYVFTRATSVAIEGTVGVWNLFPNGGEDRWMALLYALGNKLSSWITGYAITDVEFLKINITRLIGYLTYPKPDEALSGAFNLTVTNFGEGVYYFGKYFYFIFSIITGIILGTTIKYYFKTVEIDKIRQNIMITVYMMIVIFPWLMSGVIGNIFGIPTLVYMLLLYIVVRVVTLDLEEKNKNYIYNR